MLILVNIILLDGEEKSEDEPDLKMDVETSSKSKSTVKKYVNAKRRSNSDVKSKNYCNKVLNEINYHANRLI